MKPSKIPVCCQQLSNTILYADSSNTGIMNHGAAYLLRLNLSEPGCTTLADIAKHCQKQDLPLAA